MFSESFLRSLKAWLWLPVGAYLVMIPFLGPAALYVPSVVLHAPMGIMSFVDGPESWGYFGTASNLVLHLLFWGLWLAGVFGRKLLDTRGLRILWWISVILLTLTVSGCASLCLSTR